MKKQQSIPVFVVLAQVLSGILEKQHTILLHSYF